MAWSYLRRLYRNGTHMKKPTDGNGFVLLAGNGNLVLAEKIAKILGKEVTNPITYFVDGEVRVKGIPNLRRRPVYIIQSTGKPANDNLMELLLMIDAARRASADEVNVVIPYFGYARQDRKDQPRVPISSAVVANLIRSAGADRICTLDIHAEQVQGSVQFSWDNLYGSYVLVPEIKKRNLKDTVLVSPDKGGVPRVTGYAQLLGVPDIAIVYKQRDLHVNNKSEVFSMVGDVEGKDVLLIDDMLDSGGTMFNAVDHIKECGARSIRVAVTHGLFNGTALERLSASPVEEIITTDSVAHRDEVLNHPKITIVSVADMLAEAIIHIQTGASISEELILKPE